MTSSGRNSQGGVAMNEPAQLLDIITRLIAYNAHKVALAKDPTSKNLQYAMRNQKGDISYLIKVYLGLDKP